jgi:hypothetical protein
MQVSRKEAAQRLLFFFFVFAGDGKKHRFGDGQR